MFKKNEEARIFHLLRRRSVVVRLEGDEAPRLHSIIRLEGVRQGLRIFGLDLPEEERDKRRLIETEMDNFSLEERRWNPFYLEFWDKSELQERRLR